MRGCNKNKIYACFSSRQSKIGFDTFSSFSLLILVNSNNAGEGKGWVLDYSTEYTDKSEILTISK